MRWTAFGLGIAAGVLELAGAIMGLGIAGVAFSFGGGGIIPLTIGVGMAMTFAVATIFLSVAILFVQDARPIGLVILVASLGVAIAGGPWALIGAATGLIAASLTFRIDRTVALV